MDKKNERTREDAPTQYSPEILHGLLSACRTDTQKNTVKAVWGNQGIFTHELKLYANNPHQLSKGVNGRIAKAGWHIIKKEDNKRSASWRWYLVPFKQIQTFNNPCNLNTDSSNTVGGAQ